MDLPLRMQGVMMSATRGCDVTEKPREAGEGPIERHLVAWLRYCFMVPADERETLVKGAFIRPDPPHIKRWKASEMGHLPQHFYAHLMHAFQVVAFRHPDPQVGLTAYEIYEKMVHNLHLNVEPEAQFTVRLIEDRIASGTVVS